MLLYDSSSSKDIEQIFHTHLVKYGVSYDKAAKVAKILGSGKPEEILTEEENKLVTEACQEWFINYNRHRNLRQIIASIQPKTISSS
ncbi:hypothetical protein NIES2101_43595 [Calothrix sp. HK-06]|nr:hypothetical protein NIES2101_43595 [Calothrix sp. HK-06]